MNKCLELDNNNNSYFIRYHFYYLFLRDAVYSQQRYKVCSKMFGRNCIVISTMLLTIELQQWACRLAMPNVKSIIYLDGSLPCPPSQLFGYIIFSLWLWFLLLPLFTSRILYIFLTKPLSRFHVCDHIIQKMKSSWPSSQEFNL